MTFVYRLTHFMSRLFAQKPLACFEFYNKQTQ